LPGVCPLWLQTAPEQLMMSPPAIVDDGHFLRGAETFSGLHPCTENSKSSPES
jgi:hypothetical protein